MMKSSLQFVVTFNAWIVSYCYLSYI
jgi:hypothetical protein